MPSTLCPTASTTPILSGAPKINVQDVKRAAAGRWEYILNRVGGFPVEVLDGKNHPCPKCGGTDRFRLIDKEAGAVLCNQCFNEKNGDGLAALTWFCGWTFAETCDRLGEYLNAYQTANNRQPVESLLATVAAAKGVMPEWFQAYGAEVKGRNVVFPMYGPGDDGKFGQCSTFSLQATGKGLCATGKDAGLFLPAGGAAPQPGETWCVVEGVKDAAALLGLGYHAAGLHTSSMNAKFAPIFADVDVVLVPDCDAAGIAGADKSAKNLKGVARSVRVAKLPSNVKESGGEDVRDILKRLGPDAIRTAIEGATSEEKQPDALDWEPHIVRMDSIAPRKVEWLWKDRIPCGKLVSLSGNPGLGKTLVLMDIAARVTTGAAWPDGSPGVAPGGVVICSAEDDPHDTLRPRCDAAGADVSKINLVQSVFQLDGKTKRKSERLIDLQRDLEAITYAIKATPNCRLFIMDPINAYLGKTDSHKNAEVRQVLGPVAEMCHRQNVAFIYLGHLNKSSGPAMGRTAGSMAFVAAARVAYIVAEDKEDPNTRLFIPVKNNLAPNIGGLSFTVVAENDQPRVAWNNLPINTTADEALSNDPKASRSNLKTDKAWLAMELANGPRDSTELFELGKGQGISRNRLFKAKDEIGVSARKKGFGGNGGWEWSLISQPTSTDKNNGTEWDGSVHWTE